MQNARGKVKKFKIKFFPMQNMKEQGNRISL